MNSSQLFIATSATAAYNINYYYNYITIIITKKSFIGTSAATHSIQLSLEIS